MDEHHFEAPLNCDTTSYCQHMLAEWGGSLLHLDSPAFRLYALSCTADDDEAAALEQPEEGRSGMSSAASGIVGVLIGAIVGAVGLSAFQHWQVRRRGGLAEQMHSSQELAGI